MKATGTIQKLASIHANPVEYFLPIGTEKLPLNPMIGHDISLTYLNKIECIGCHKITKKSFQQGYCFPCSQKLARCDFCIIKPERCHYHLGTCREPEWGVAHCMIPHIVYLANASGLKVGITRHTQVPTRWIDQGAIQALPIFEVPSRQISGFVEIALAQFISDKTHWQKMLKNHTTILNLREEFENLKTEILEALKPVYNQFGEKSVNYLSDAIETNMTYPVLTYPEKVQALSFDKQEVISGKLLGIKGQYLILDTGVLNIRKFTGYQIAVS
jgi:hypothetical protein